MGRTIGAMMWKKRWKALAPSSRARSRISSGIAVRPARMMMAVKGKPRQMFTAITEPIA